MRVIVVFLVAIAACHAGSIELRNLEDEENLLLEEVELARRQGTLSGSLDTQGGKYQGNLGYEHAFNRGNTKLGGGVNFGSGRPPTFGISGSHTLNNKKTTLSGDVSFGRGQRPGFGVGVSHTFRNGAKLSGGARFSGRQKSFGVGLSIPFGRRRAVENRPM